MKKRMRLLASVMSVMISVSTISTMHVQAASATSTFASAVESISLVYDQSVIARTIGRAGAETRDGSKGVIFELLLKDKQNMDIVARIKNGTKTIMSKSSIDQVADLITTDRKGIEKLIQCKDSQSPTGIKKIIEQVKSGQYKKADLIGTTETAKAYNAKALENNLQTMTDSKISCERTAAIAAKKFGTTTFEDIAKKAVKSAKGTAIFSGVFALAESIYDKDSFSETVSNVSVETANGAAVGYATAYVGDSMLLAVTTSAGSTSAVATIVPVAISIGTAVVIYYIIDLFEEQFDIKGQIADIVDDSLVFTYNLASQVADKSAKLGANVATKASEFGNSVVEKTNNARNYIITQYSSIDFSKPFTALGVKR